MVTLAPGIVQYLKIEDFLQSDIEDALAHLRSLSDKLEIKPPRPCFYALSFGKAFTASMPEGLVKLNRTRLDFPEYDNLFKDESWEQKLRSHHKLGQLFLTEAMSTSVYCSFFDFFRLKQHAFEECLNSWIKQAFLNGDLIESYRKSDNHLVVRHTVRDHEFEFVFAKTPFIREQLQIAAHDEAERKAATDLELLRRSKFDCYIYLMEDLRNKTFKIGKSKTPGKRERTLQSEVPQIVMRFSVPAEEQFEKQLHEHFENKRQRGEWFTLSDEDLGWVVAFLKSKGDASRVFIDFQWFGSVSYASAAQ